MTSAVLGNSFCLKSNLYSKAWLSGVSALAISVVSLPALAETLHPELERVVLSTGGVGYFEYGANADGPVDIPIEVRLDQMDDVLKSLVVYDAKGTAGLIRMPGKAPLEEAFRDLPFRREALGSMSALMNALTGAEVVIAGDRELRGRIVNVVPEYEQTSTGASHVLQNRLTLLTRDGLQSTIVERSTNIRFTDPKLQHQIDEALLALASNRKQDRRELSLSLQGNGKRPVRVGYVVAAPLWKASYRLSVTEGDDKGEGQLLGWAILENLSGEDWKDIELVVTSGNPVTFRQALYESYYVDRPSIPVEVLGRILPPVDQGSVSLQLGMSKEAAAQNELRKARGSLEAFRRPAMMADGLAMADSAAPMSAMAGNMPMEAEPVPAAGVVAASSQEAATQVIFKYPHPVSLANGQSVMLPIVTGTVKAEQVSLYNSSTHPSHPMASVRLTNDGDFGLPPGVVTLYARPDQKSEVNFAGDAQLSPLPVGDDRLLSFALDQKVSIVPKSEYAEYKVGGKIADGILELNVRQSSLTAYTIENTAGKDRTILIEHQKQPGWSLSKPDPKQAGDIEETDRYYRIPVRVPAGKTVTETVVLERPVEQRFQLSSLNTGQISAFVSAKTLSPALRDALNELAGYQRKVAEKKRALDNIDGQINRRQQEQERVRRLLTSVPSNSDIYRRYLADLNKQEDQMQRLQSQRYQADSAHEQARAALLNYVRGLKLDAK